MMMMMMMITTTQAVSESFQEVATAASDGSIKAGLGLGGRCFVDGLKDAPFHRLDQDTSRYLGVNYRVPEF